MQAGFRHFLDLAEVPAPSLRLILAEALRRKRSRASRPKGAPDADAPLIGRTLAMIFQKPSTRTRVSFDMAMRQLGGGAIMLGASDLQLGRGETIADTARVLSGYVDALMLRAMRHEDLEALAQHAAIPVVNGLTDRSHPCQILADLMTLQERFGRIEGLRLAWIGDGNNVCRSLIEAAPAFGFSLTIAAPAGFAPAKSVLQAAAAVGGDVRLCDDPVEAVQAADAVVTDTWVSMGDADEDARRAAFAPYAVTPDLMACAAAHAVFLHCLPAHRGEEVAADVLDGPQSVVWQEAENRLHAQKAVLLWCLGALNPEYA